MVPGKYRYFYFMKLVAAIPVLLKEMSEAQTFFVQIPLLSIILISDGQGYTPGYLGLYSYPYPPFTPTLPRGRGFARVAKGMAGKSCF